MQTCTELQHKSSWAASGTEGWVLPTAVVRISVLELDIN